MQLPMRTRDHCAPPNQIGDIQIRGYGGLSMSKSSVIKVFGFDVCSNVLLASDQSLFKKGRLHLKTSFPYTLGVH